MNRNQQINLTRARGEKIDNKPEQKSLPHIFEFSKVYQKHLPIRKRHISTSKRKGEKKRCLKGRNSLGKKKKSF